MRKILLLVSALLLAACQSTPVQPPVEPIKFISAPYALKVATINITEDFTTTHHTPHVEYQFETPPDQAMKDWATSRLVAAGQQNRLEVDIIDASVIRTNIPKQKTGIEGFFTKEQTEEYEGTLEVTLKIYDNRKILPVANAHVTAHQTLTLREDANLLDRKALYQQMTFNLMQQIDTELDKNIRQYFANYLL